MKKKILGVSYFGISGLIFFYLLYLLFGMAYTKVLFMIGVMIGLFFLGCHSINKR